MSKPFPIGNNAWLATAWHTTQFLLRRRCITARWEDLYKSSLHEKEGLAPPNSTLTNGKKKENSL
jgi:hypothetical protein